MIPESWQPLIAQWAVYVLGALAVTSALVHVLAPIARRVQRWTLTTAATWDDGPARWVADRLEWLSGALAVVLPMLPHVTALRDERPAKKREPLTKGPPSDGAALAFVLVVAAAALHATGCGAGAYGSHARAATIGAAGLSATGDVIDAARDRALDAVEAAHPVHGPERDAALEAEAARWRPAGVALDDAREGLLTYIDAVQLAATSGADGLVAHLDVIAARFLALFNAVVATATEAGATGLQPLNLDALFGGGQ